MKIYPERTVQLLSIGTEITSGQIINSNASWIATKLDYHRLTVIEASSCPDDREVILNNLKTKTAPFVFVTGGLGPTVDDITRDCISEWLNLPLAYDEFSFDHILAYFKKFNRVPTEKQKRQCYFPKGAEILFNEAGTANGFCMTTDRQKIWVLPGPPAEIQAIWSKYIDESLSKIKTDDFEELTSWSVLGVPESELESIAEKFFKPENLGFRLNRPYVEVKLWHPKDSEPITRSKLEFEKHLGTKIKYKGNNELVAQFIKKIISLPQITLVDETGSAQLLQKMLKAKESLRMKTWPKNVNLTTMANSGPQGSVFGLRWQGAQLQAYQNIEGMAKSQIFSNLYPDEMIERNLFAGLEMALEYWLS